MRPPRESDDRVAAFEREAIPHMDAVFRFGLRLSGSRAEAEDLVQETFLRAFRSWEQYTPGTRCKSWLLTICRNVFLRRHERDRRQEGLLGSSVDLDDDGEVIRPLWATVSGSDPETEFFGSIIDAAVVAAIDALPEEHRSALLLSDVEGLSYAEISEVLDVPLGTVKSRLFRARRHLQRALYEYAVEAGLLRPSRGAGA